MHANVQGFDIRDEAPDDDDDDRATGKEETDIAGAGGGLKEPMDMPAQLRELKRP